MQSIIELLKNYNKTILVNSARFITEANVRRNEIVLYVRSSSNI